MGKRLFWLLALLLMTANSYFAADLLVTQLTKKLATVTDFDTSPDQHSSPTTLSNNYSDYLIINERNFFQTVNKSEKEAAEKALEQVPAAAKPLTELKLKLLGTVVGIGLPVAIILNLRNKEENIYHEGESIADEATITKIYRNKVLLDHGGKEEMLLAFESDLSVPGSEEPVGSPQSKESVEGQPSGRFELGNLGKRVNQNRWELDRQEVTKAIDNANQLLTQVRIIPHFTKGDLNQPDGFQVSHVKPGGFFDKLGVMPGDIIKEVNGEPVNSPEQAFAAYQKFKNEANVRIMLERQSKIQTLIYDIH